MLNSLLAWKSIGMSRFGAVSGAFVLLVLMTGCDPCMNNPCDDGTVCNGEETCTADGGQAVCADGAPIECADGLTCTEPDGTCSAADPCMNNPCDDGMACNGEETCTADGDQAVCADGTPVACADGETCTEPDGTCFAADPCEGVTCADCESCVDGACVQLEGDAGTGETYYVIEGCAGCHAEDGSGDTAPSIIGAECSLIFDKLSGAVFHAGGERVVTGQDAADLEAWLAP
ncbi:MAG: hypothetical protein IIC02_05380 [Planctomycetes bacterium]|nr:hypothetical protein [Planctomycetota bacterium]